MASETNTMSESTQEGPSRFVETPSLLRARDMVQQTARLFRSVSPRNRCQLAAELADDGQPPLERLLGQALLEAAKEPGQQPAAASGSDGHPALRKGFELFRARRPAYLKELVVKYRLRRFPPEAVAIGGRILSSNSVFKLFADLKYEPREHLCVLHLSGDNSILSVDQLAVGTMKECPCSPGELFRNAILAGACAVVLVHNHPSGTPYPSPGDQGLMRDICEAGELLRLTVVDFIIVGDESYWSAADANWIREGRYVACSEPAPIPVRRGRLPKELPKAAAR